MDVPTIHFATFIEELGETSDKLALQYFPSIFWDEHNVKYVPMDGMSIPPKYWFWHTFLLYHTMDTGSSLDPRLKSRGLRLGLSNILD